MASVDVIMLHGVSNKLGRWRWYILETLKLITWIKWVGRLSSRLEFDTVGLSAFDIFVCQIVLGLVQAKMELTRTCSCYVLVVQLKLLLVSLTGPYFWLSS